MHNRLFNLQFPTLNKPLGNGQIKRSAADFQVIEHNAADWSGCGEHWWLKIEKTSSNTAWAATQLASACRVPARQVGYAGLKDRHAITQQWFSIQLPKVKTLPEVTMRLPDELRVIDDKWHKNKLKTGYLTHNEFIVRVYGLDCSDLAIKERLQTIIRQGVPNYFGPQRFGHQMHNIDQASKWFKQEIRVNNRNKRSLYLSAARSYLFNLMVAERIRSNHWLHPMGGDVLQLAGSHSWFADTSVSQEDMIHRLNKFDIHLTAAMWGDGPPQSHSDCAELENQIATQHPELTAGLIQHRLSPARRAMRMVVSDLQHKWLEDVLELHFSLPPGGFATCVLRELFNIEDCSAVNND
ncbi:tRNA pseudouridine(13) synthase TruD [Marinicella sediminis]|nr:tRNA pseudouridine(13) synthase TruD [Marinicella sediminis]